MRGFFALTVLASTVVRVSSCPTVPTPPPDAKSVQFDEGFERGLGGWLIDADLPQDPNRPGQPVLAAIEATDERALSGSSSARITLDGRQDDGTIWLQRVFSVTPGTPYRIDLSFAFWSQTESFNTLAKVAVFAGVDRPRVEGDFNLDEAANLVAGWRQYDYSFTANSDANGQIWVAFGVSAAFETQLVYFIDNVQIDIQPR